MTGTDTVVRLISLVSRLAGPERTPRGAGPDTRLTGGGFWLNSVGLLELVVTCEKEFGVAFDSEGDLTPDTLRSIGSLAAAIARKLDPRQRDQ